MFFASNAPVSTKHLAWFLGLFLASFLVTANNAPNFTATSTKKFELHILAPLPTWIFFAKTTKLLNNFVKVFVNLV